MKGHFRIKPLIIAAAMIVVLALVGFALAARSEIRTIDGRVYDIKFTVQSQVTIPDEDLGQIKECVKTLSELFETFNVTTLFNDNFTETDAELGGWRYHDDKLKQLQFVYDLIDNQTGQSIWVSADIALTEDAYFKQTYGGNALDGSDFEFITLNDGSTALIFQDHTAYFTYNGIFYDIVLNFPQQVHVKDILSRFGVL